MPENDNQNVERRPLSDPGREQKGVLTEVVIPGAVGVGANLLTPVVKDGAGNCSTRSSRARRTRSASGRTPACRFRGLRRRASSRASAEREARATHHASRQRRSIRCR